MSDKETNEMAVTICQRIAPSGNEANALPTKQTLEGIDIKPLYTADDIAPSAHLNTYPGQMPFTRGPKASMYVGKAMDYSPICWLFNSG